MNLIIKQVDKEPLSENCPQFKARQLLVPGTELYGYCGGRFGRDSYQTKTVIEVEGNGITVSIMGSNALHIFEIYDWVGLIESSNREYDQLIEGD